MIEYSQEDPNEVLLKVFSAEIANGRASIVLAGSGKWEQIGKLDCFVMGRLRQDKLKNCKEADIDKHDSDSRKLNILDGLKSFQVDAGLDNESDVLLCGDAFDIGINCKLGDVIEKYKTIFDWMHHVYLFSEHKRWCFGCMFEDYIFWGEYSA